MCLALVVGNMIGSGIFLLPASLAPYGLNSIFGWIFSASGGVLLAIVFAQLSRVYPQAGGPYVYPRVAFGECCGFVMAWGYWMSVWVGNAAIAIGTRRLPRPSSCPRSRRPRARRRSPPSR